MCKINASVSGQNDVSSPLDVLLIDDDSQRAEWLAQALDQSRYRVSHLVGSNVSLLKEVDYLQPDVIIIDIESPNRDILESLAVLNAQNPKPVVMFSEKEDTNTITQSVTSGVSAYVVGDTPPEKIRPILDAAVARFHSFQSLRTELDSTKKQLASRKKVDRAKALLMEQKGLSEQQAFQTIRKMAMDQSKTMDEVADSIVSVLSALNL